MTGWLTYVKGLSQICWYNVISEIWRAFLNNKLKRRLIVVTGVIVIVIVSVLAIVGSAGSSKIITVAQAASGSHNGTKVQVTGKVLPNSFAFSGSVLTFSIYDDESGPNTTVKVVYEQGVSSTFGNDVIAICTGKLDDDGVLRCTELVTKCPSKYESAADALSVEKLLSYGQDIIGNPVKVTGVVKAGSLKPAGQKDRFIITDPSGGRELSIQFDGALSAEIKDGSTVVITGALSSTNTFAATGVALKG